MSRVLTQHQREAQVPPATKEDLAQRALIDKVKKQQLVLAHNYCQLAQSLISAHIDILAHDDLLRRFNCSPVMDLHFAHALRLPAPPPHLNPDNFPTQETNGMLYIPHGYSVHNQNVIAHRVSFFYRALHERT